jgi:mono/diheme cytochrome c family protein
MDGTLFKVGAVVLGTVGFYTLIASTIPQIESDVPAELDLTGTVTAEQLVALGEELYQGAGGCAACHAGGVRAPVLVSDYRGAGPIGERCAHRVAGKDCKTYLYDKLMDPSSYQVEGYAPIMPAAGRTLSQPQVWALVAFLENAGGEVTVSAADLPSNGAADAGAPAAQPPAGPMSLEPLDNLRDYQCIACHQLAGEGTTLGPPLDGIGGRMSADAIRAAILDPDANIAQGYEAMAGVMPRDFGTRMSAAQLEAVVSYLAAQR